MKKYFQLLRPCHWIKNILIFIPALFNQSIINKWGFVRLLICFISFSFLSSSVYIINDIFDRESDRMHELKKKRPIAQGSITVKKAWLICFLLLVVSMIFLSIPIMDFPKIMYYIAGLYLLLNIIYSKYLKKVPIVDVIILSAGFIIRVIEGALASSVVLSQWFLLTILMFSLYMGLGKRRNEIRFSNGKGDIVRTVLKYYSDDYLDKMMLLSMTLGLVFYSLWAAFIAENNILIWTVPLVIAIIMRYELVIDNGKCGDPVEVLLKDKALIVMVLGYMIIIFGVLYFL